MRIGSWDVVSMLCHSGGDPSLLFRPLTNRAKPTHIMEVHLSHSKSTDLSVNRIWKTPSQQHLDQCLTQQLGAAASPNWRLKLTITLRFLVFTPCTLRFFCFLVATLALWNCLSLILLFLIYFFFQLKGFTGHHLNPLKIIYPWGVKVILIKCCSILILSLHFNFYCLEVRSSYLLQIIKSGNLWPFFMSSHLHLQIG